MYETACDHIDEDTDIIASHTISTDATTDDTTDVTTNTNTDTDTEGGDSDLLLPPSFRARALHLKAGDCAHRSSR